MIFGSFLMFIAVMIAGVSAYFSVYGLAHIFAATFWSVVIMGGVLEVGKLVATSFLYRYWDALRWSLRIYLLSAILGLMAITSAGIFGYLSNAYQQDTVGVKDVVARIELLDTELKTLSERDQQINADIDRIGSNFVTARQNMMKQYAPEKSKITERIAHIRSEKLDLSTKQLEVEAHTGPIIYIAKAMGKGIDEAVMWMICLIIFVFDPLAVALTIGANIALSTKRPVRQREGPRPSYLDPELLNNVVAASETRLQERMDRIKLESEQEFFARMTEMAQKLDRGEEVPSHNTTSYEDKIEFLTARNAELNDALETLKQLPPEEPRVEYVTVTEPLPAGMQLVEVGQYMSLRQAMIDAADDLQALEGEVSNKQDLIETLSTDNQRLEDELFTLATAFEKKETQIAQLKDAIRALEQQDPQSSYTIQERADLHARNVAATKA